jgi:S-adenosylmethionine hydrolase
MNPIIAMLTDFGNTDIYVGVIQGVILGICPQARIVNVTNAVQPHNVRQGAVALLDAYSYFPQGAIFLVVIDPGVGSTRRPIAAHAGGYTFVAPDNGVLTYAVLAGKCAPSN